MKNENNVSHKRYYIFRHIQKSEQDSIRYLGKGPETWTTDFSFASLHAHKNFARELAENYKVANDQFTYVIGEVDVSINSFFMGEVV